MNSKTDVLHNVADPTDYDREDWQRLKTVWGHFRPLTVREQVEADQLTDQVRQKCIFRFDTEISPGMRLDADGRTWEVQTIIDVDNAHQYLEATVVQCQTI